MSAVVGGPADWARRSGGVGERSAAVEAPLVEAAVHMSFKALRYVKAEGLAGVEGDERVPASSLRIGQALHFRYRLVPAEVQGLDGLAPDPYYVWTFTIFPMGKFKHFPMGTPEATPSARVP
ncbi:hypothetical protein [Streptomyces sp. NPDC055287]